MTVSNQDVRQATEGNSVLTQFSFTFPVQSAGDILVIYRDSAGVETELTNGVDFSTALSGGGLLGGTITLSSIVPDADEWISIILKPPVTQGVDLNTVGALPAQALEDNFDKLVNLLKHAILDQLQNRVIRLTEGAIASEPSHAHDAGSHRIINVTDPVNDQDVATKAFVLAEILASEIVPGSISNLSAFSATRLADTSAGAWLTGLGVNAFWQAVLDETNLANSLNAMGFSTVVKNILQDTTAAAILTELGLTTLAQSLVDDTTTSAARATLEVKADVFQENELINGDMQVWQGGTSFSAPADDTYCADQWIYLYDTAGASPLDITKGTSTPPTNGKAYLRGTVRAGGANRKFAFVQPIESRVAASMSGRAISASVSIRGLSDLTGFSLHLIQWNGIADSITSDVILAWNAATVAPSLNAGWTYVTSGSLNLTATGSFQTFSIQNVTVSANQNNLAWLLVSNDAGWSDGAQFDFSEALLVRGAFAVPFRSRWVEDELQRCERYFQKTFAMDTAPAAGAGFPGALHAQNNSQNAGSPRAACFWSFRTRMRGVPSMAGFNPSLTGGASDWRNTGDSASRTATFVNPGENGVLVHTDTNTDTNIYAIHATANARL